MGRALALNNLDQVGEAAEEARRSLAVAREIGYPTGEILALSALCFAARSRDDLDHAVQLARQAAQITAGVPGVCLRWCSYVLTGALILAGDLAGADNVCAAGLARSRDVGDVFNQWSLLPCMVFLDVHAGRFEHAVAHLREGLQIAVRTGGWFELGHYLDSCGYLCAATGRPAEALTMWTASAVLLAPAGLRLRDLPLRAARQALGADRTRAAEERGAAMNLAAAAQYALMLTAPGPERPAAAPGPEQLSVRERELVTLVARGRTNAQIAAELFLSVRTVGSHLDRIRDKTGCRRRADLTRLALTTGLV